MIVIVNKLGESLEYDYSKIRLVEKLNHLTYKVSLNPRKKYKEIDFNTKENAENEYPIMIIIENEMRHLFKFTKNMKKNINRRNKFIEKIINYGNIPYSGLKRYMFYAKLKTLWFRTRLYFMKLYYGGLLNKKIKADTPTTNDLFPDFCDSYDMLQSVNRTHTKVLKIMDELKKLIIEKNISEKEQEKIFLSSINHI